MKHVLTIILAFMSLCMVAQTKVENVDAATFKKLIDEKKYELIDLRTDDELTKKGFIKGAKQIDWFKKDAEATIKALDKTKTYLVYCAAGGRSGQCAELMAKEGFTKVYNLSKGFDDWKKQGFDIELKK